MRCSTSAGVGSTSGRNRGTGVGYVAQLASATTQGASIGHQGRRCADGLVRSSARVESGRGSRDWDDVAEDLSGTD
jgi:hypothetical protein